MSDLVTFEDRLAAWTRLALEALSPAKRAELELLAQVEPGMKMSRGNDQLAVLWWAGCPIGVTSWAWLESGAEPTGLEQVVQDFLDGGIYVGGDE